MSERLAVDLAIIGSGPGGYKAALTAAHLGARVALIEKGLAGGTCLNLGCIPKKTLLHLAALIEDVNALQGRGLTGRVYGDFPAAMAHQEHVIAGIRDNFAVWLKRLGVRMVSGSAAFSGPRALTVTGADGAVTHIDAAKTIIATGSEPAPVPGCATDGRLILDSRDFMMRLRELPGSVLFVGGGTIGVELGYLLHQFGARVSIAEQEERLLHQSRIPERASTFLERKFKRIGIEVLTGTRVVGARPQGDAVEVEYAGGRRARYDRVVIAAGRRPFHGGLELAAAGVETDDDGYVRVNEHLETSVPGIYAIGDVKGGLMTANNALHDAKVAAANAVNGNHYAPNYFKVPIVIHSAYEIAAVGLTEDQAEHAGFDADVARASMGGSGKARAHHDYEGFIEVVHDGETGQLLGGCIVGPEAGEQIHMLGAACQSTRGLWFFKDMSYSHPSWCEELETAIDPYTSALTRSDKPLFQAGIFAGRG